MNDFADHRHILDIMLEDVVMPVETLSRPEKYYYSNDLKFS